MKRIKKQSLVIVLLLVMSAIICFNVNPVSAQVLPIINSVEKYTSGTDTVLNITVTMPTVTGQYNPLNFVDHLEIEIDGAFPYAVVNVGSIEKIHFSAEYNMGEVTGTPSVRVRYVNNVGGYGDWTEPIVIPEFSLIHLAPILIVISIAVLLIRSKLATKSTK